MRKPSTIGVMEEHRHRVEELVEDPETAEILKPYYRYICKRPCFHDEYLSAYNCPNVTLVDCPAGLERITETGPVVSGRALRGRLHHLRDRLRA